MRCRGYGRARMAATQGRDGFSASSMLRGAICRTSALIPRPHHFASDQGRDLCPRKCGGHGHRCEAIAKPSTHHLGRRRRYETPVCRLLSRWKVEPLRGRFSHSYRRDLCSSDLHSRSSPRDASVRRWSALLTHRRREAGMGQRAGMTPDGLNGDGGSLPAHLTTSVTRADAEVAENLCRNPVDACVPQARGYVATDEMPSPVGLME